MKRLSAASGRGLDARDHPPLGRPGFGGIGERAEATHVVGLALDAAHVGILGESGNSGQQDRVAGEPEDVADAVALAPGHGFVPGVVAVAAHQDLDPGPAGANRFHDMPQDQGDLGAGRRLAGLRITATGLPVVAS
jgi:hypothetical protein